MSVAIKTDGSWYQDADLSTAFDSNAGNLLVCFTVSLHAVDTPTYNGVEFTQQILFQHPVENSGGNNNLQIWTLANPASGSNTFAVSRTTEGNRMFVALFSLSGIEVSDAVEGTDSFGENTVASVGHDPNTNDMSITQADTRESIVIMFGSVTPNSTGTNYHNAGTGYTEYIDTQDLQDSSNVGRYMVYRIYTDSGAKTIDDGSDNFDSPGPGSSRTRAQVSIMVNGHINKAQLLTCDP